MISHFNALPTNAKILLSVFLVALALAPILVGDYILSILILVLYFAYLGQSWNILMGYTGLLSLGHALFFGIGAYITAGMFVNFGLSPWIGMILGMILAGGVGALIGYLGFRFKISGVHFALLTIAFAEFTRVVASKVDWIGGSSGLFLPATKLDTNNIWLLRGDPTMFYYVLLIFTLGLMALVWYLSSARIGYYWRAIREDEAAAEAMGINVFKYKMLAVVYSTASASLAGAIFAFYANNLYPDLTFSMHRSIELMLGVIIGGMGTLFGPILGAALLTILGEGLTIAAEHIELDGIKQFAYGAALLVIIWVRPRGLWPWIHDKLKLGGRN